MIIACPACGTKYVVPDDALGVEGRTVRCAKCKHSWFQDGPAIDLPVDGETGIEREPGHPAPVDAPGSQGIAVDDANDGPTPEQPVSPPVAREHATQDGPGNDTWAVQPAAAATPAPQMAQPPAAPPVAQPIPMRGTLPDEPSRKRRGASVGATPDENEADRANTGPASLPDAAVTPPPFYRASDKPAPPPGSREAAASRSQDTGYSSFDYEPPFRPRRNRLRLFTLAAAGFAALAFLAIAAVQMWGVPSWFPASQPLFAGHEPGLTMSFPDDRQQTRALRTGGEFLAVSGTIANTGRETRAVPPILIVLRDERNRVVYSQEIAPPAARLAPGERREVNEAIADIPASATAAEFGWAPR